MGSFSGCSVARYRASMGCWRSSVQIRPSRLRKMKAQLLLSFLFLKDNISVHTNGRGKLNIKTMKGYFLIIITIVLCASCSGTTDRKTSSSTQEQNNNEIVTTTFDKEGIDSVVPTPNARPLIEDFIPKDWKTILHETGDLNNDGIDDHVIVIEDTKPENVKTNDKLGQDTLNINPRTLMVFFKEKSDGYTLVAQSGDTFIPSENDEESTCLADPLMTEGGITIQKGILTIGLQYWLSCGSWYVNNVDYKFRYQNQKMVLIGFDHSEFHRSSGEQSSTSINFSTGKMEQTTGYNMFDDTPSKPKTTTSKWKGNKIYSLDNCDERTYFEILDI